MNIFSLLLFALSAPALTQAAFISSISSVLSSLSAASATSRSGINFSSGVYTVLILPRSSSSSSRSSSTSTSTSTSSSTTTSSTTVSTTTVTPTTTATPTTSSSTTTVTPTTTITPTTTSSQLTTTTTVTPTTTITPTSSVCPINATTVTVFPASYCTTLVVCGPAVSGCPMYNSSFMSQLSSLAGSTSTSSGSTRTSSSSSGSTRTSTSTETGTAIVISSASTGVVSSPGQTIVTSGAIVIEINDDGTTSTVFEAAGNRKYRANSTNSSGAFSLASKSGTVTAIITLLSAFLLGVLAI